MDVRVIRKKYKSGFITYTLQTNRLFKIIPWFWHDYCYYNKAGSFVKAEERDINDIYPIINELRNCENKIVYFEKI